MKPRPLHVRATLLSGLQLSLGFLALDSLLAAAKALRDHLPPVLDELPPPLEVPLQREPGGRFHLASVAVAKWEAFEVRYTNRRFPLEEAQRLGDSKLKRIHLTSGPTKSHRLPGQVGWVTGDVLEWWALGDLGEVTELLGWVTHLGKRRGVGCGRVGRWTVGPCETWPGFPVVREGKALRPLPLDWPGLVGPLPGYGNLDYPYWYRPHEQLLAMPETAHG